MPLLCTGCPGPCAGCPLAGLR
ncbi:hypothetical protein D854_gp86 [Streptomyces phage R4]|uniref:Uncharacterized protein n=1 Tax=Streptomyces phage R4 TaxID=10732 RepID=K4HY60_9CAUD|nr:hypothetical protein D854_gp86 [Streptomyces phage R4]AFU62056.1 hypothetical protein R4_3 [Streptomyces phage R4]